MKKIICLVGFLFSVSANATLIGDEVGCSTTGTSWSCTTPTAVVSDSLVEFGLMLHTHRAFDVDIGTNSLDFDVLVGVGNIFGIGPVSIFDIDSIITGFSFSTNISGLDASRLTFTSDSLNVNFDGLSTQVGQFLNITLDTASVSEPGSIVILALGLVGLSLSRKKIIS